MSSNLSDQERAKLTNLVMEILQSWQVTDEEQLNLLGMAGNAKARSLSRYRHGTSLPDDDAIMERAKHILGIQEALFTVFALNRNMPAFWLNHRNRQLRGIPMSIMLDEGLDGMNRVWRILDCTVGWTD